MITTLVRMVTLDLQCCGRSVSYGASICNLRLDSVDDFDILEMANLIARPLLTGEMRFRDGRQPSQPQRTDTDNGALLVRIRG